MVHILSIDLPSSQEENKAVQDALEELNLQLVLYESLGKGPEHAEEEKRQASKVIDAMHKVSRAHTDTKVRAEYQKKLQAGWFSGANRKERGDHVNSLLKNSEFALRVVGVQSHEETDNQGKELSIQVLKDAVTISEETAWKNALDELNKQLVLYDRLGQGPEQTSEKEQAAKVVDAMRKVSDAHTDPKVKEEYLKKAEKFKKASPRERKKEMNALLKGLVVLLATPFLLAGAAIFAAGSILYGVGTIVKGLGNLVTGGKLDSLFDKAQKQSDASSESGQEERQ